MNNNTKIILIGGGSSSGKTYISKKVLNAFGSKNINHICIDDYYKDLTDLSMEERNKINYDSPNSFDWDLLFKQINMLKEGKHINKPIYDYSIHNRCKEYEVLEPKKITIIEGIMALVKEDIRVLGDYKVFVSARPETRLLRRLSRDYKERGRSYESILKQYYDQVIPVFEEIIEPTQKFADMILINEDNDNKSIEVLMNYIQNHLL